MEKLNYYFVCNKADDYGNRRDELVHTTEKNSKEYYYAKNVDNQDIEILKKYFDVLSYEEESERSEDERFYGSD